MEQSRLVLGLLQVVLGKSKPSTKGNYAFHCPFCKHHKPKLEVDPKTGFYHCWTCHPETKGRRLVNLLKKAGASSNQIAEMRAYFPGTDVEIEEKKYAPVTLPPDYTPLEVESSKHTRRRAMAYLMSRGLTNQDIIKYRIGYCEKGRYANSIIIPSYDKAGQLNYFVARSFEQEDTGKYNAPSCNKNQLIGFEYYINWDVPVILCEGAFDAIAIKRNAIPLFGKTIPKALMLKLVESSVKTVYIALDDDAIEKSMEYAMQLINRGKDIYLLELEGKDPSKVGFEQVTKYLHKAKQLTFGDLLKRKIQSC